MPQKRDLSAVAANLEPATREEYEREAAAARLERRGQKTQHQINEIMRTTYRPKGERFNGMMVADGPVVRRMTDMLRAEAERNQAELAQRLRERGMPE